jgi:hypothetical protein
VAGEVQVVVRPPGGKCQEPLHPSAKIMFLAKVPVFLGTIATIHVSLCRHVVWPQILRKHVAE